MPITTTNTSNNLTNNRSSLYEQAVMLFRRAPGDIEDTQILIDGIIDQAKAEMRAELETAIANLKSSTNA